MAEKPTSNQPQHGEVQLKESRALVVTSQILAKKWLVIGVPVVAIIIAVILMSVSSSKRKARHEAAVVYEKAEISGAGTDGFLEISKEYSNTPYGAYALAAAIKSAYADGDFGRSLELSKEFTQSFPRNSFAAFAKRFSALSMEAQGDFRGAIDVYTDILENDPAGQLIANTLNIDIGRCYEQLGEFQTAKSYYRKVKPSAGTATTATKYDVTKSTALDMEADYYFSRAVKKEREASQAKDGSGESIDLVKPE